MASAISQRGKSLRSSKNHDRLTAAVAEGYERPDITGYRWAAEKKMGR